MTVVAACHGTLERLAIAGSAVTDAGAACALARLSPFARLASGLPRSAQEKC